MRHSFRNCFLFFFCLLSAQIGFGQNETQPVLDTNVNPLSQPDTTGLTGINQDTTAPITSLSPDLLNIFNQPVPKKYRIADIKVTGNNYFDQNLLLSIASLSVGDEVSLPGGDNFSESYYQALVTKYFSDVAIYITSLKDDAITVEVNVTERPRLSKFEFKGIKKSEVDDLSPKTGLVVTGLSLKI
jgi:outer membrane protein insertion porin family